MYRGFPVLVRGHVPASIKGTRGSVVAVELVAAKLPRKLEQPVSDDPALAVLKSALPLDAVRRVHFRSSEERDEFVAGLRILEEGLPATPPLLATPELFVGEWDVPSAGNPELQLLAGRWARNLERQARVSAALMVGSAVSGIDGWGDPCVEQLRSKDRAEACEAVRALAVALARINPVAGWGADELGRSLREVPDHAGDGLAAFARAWAASQDPFSDEVARPASSDAEVALDLVLGLVGLAPREYSERLVANARELGAPRAAALAGLLLGRHLLPRSLRPMLADTVFARQEIAAVALGAARSPPVRRARSRVARLGFEAGLVLSVTFGYVRPGNSGRWVLTAA